MIVVRDVFQLKFGKAKQALALLKPMINSMRNTDAGIYRLLTDLVGNYYTVVLEGTFNSMEDYQKIRQQAFDPEWAALYEQFTDYVISGYRDIWTVVE